MQTHFDYIIIGAGLSGLTTALRMSRDPFFSNKTIAIIEKDLSKGNDRTWCFWETEADLFEKVVSHTWETILVKGQGYNSAIPIDPYVYKKIESGDLYAFVKGELSQHSNITFIEDEVEDVVDHQDYGEVITPTTAYRANLILNSIYRPNLLNDQKEAVVLQQHFVGWFVKTDTPVFNPEVATYMDFSIPQNGNCRFMYVLPTSPTEALLEYTLFSEDLLPKATYEEAIKDYLDNLGVKSYQIVDQEQGSIPMTTYDFTKHNSPHILHIGTAGGWTKASTGYTFKHTVKKSAALIAFLKSGKDPETYSIKNRWTFYDAVLLEVLSKHNELGAEIFTRMFEKGRVDNIFRFLDEESSFKDELSVILSTPKVPFIKAALKVLSR